VATVPASQDPVTANNSVDAQVTVFVVPDLTVTPTPANQRIPFGDVAPRSFSTAFTVANGNIATISDLKVVIPTPAVAVTTPPTVLVLTALTSSVGGTCDVATATCSYTTFAKNTSTTVTATWTISREAAALQFTATASTPAASPTPVNTSGTQVVDVVSVDLAVSVTGVPAQIAAGTPFTATFTVQNLGPSATATGASLLVSWDPALTAALPGGCSSTGPSSASCTLGPLAAAPASGSSTSFNIQFTGSVAGRGSRTITGLAKAPGADTPSTTDNEEPSSKLVNNTAMATVVVFVVPVVTVTPAPATQRVPFGDGPNRTFDTAFTVANDPTVDVSNLTVTIPTPSASASPALLQLDALTSSDGSPCSIVTHTCTYTTLAANTSVTVTATWTISQAKSGIQFTATATAPNPTPVAGVSGTQVVDVVSVDLRTAITVPASRESGTPFTVTVTVTNLGPSATATGASVLVSWDPLLPQTGGLPAGCASAGPSSATCTLPPLAVNADASFAIQFTGSNAGRGNRTITAVAKAPGADTASTDDNEEPASKLANNTASGTVLIQTTAGFTITATPPTLRVPVYPLPAPPVTTFDVKYTLVNDATTAIDGLTVTVPTPPVPAGRTLSATAATPAACAVTPSVVTCTFPTYPASTTTPVTITYTITGTDPADLVRDFVATATAANTTPLPPPASATVRVTVVEAKADLQVVSVGYGPPDQNHLQVPTGTPSGTFDAFITVRNAGPDTAQAPKLTFTPGTNIALTTTATGVTCTPPTNVCTFPGDIASGASSDLVIRFTLIASADGVHTRSATFVAGSATVDPDLTNNGGTVTGSINRAPAPKPDTGADSGPTVPSGGTLTFKTFVNGDSDPDTDVLQLICAGEVQPPTTPSTLCPLAATTVTFSATGGITPDNTPTVVITRNVDGTLTVTPTLTPLGTPPATPRVVRITIPVSIIDGQGATVSSQLELAVTETFAASVTGSYANSPPTPPESFGQKVSASRLGPSENTFAVLGGALGTNANGAAFTSTPMTYALSTVDDINVTGTVAKPATSDPNKITYIPAAGYTSDPPTRTPTDLADAPPDSFHYRATGMRGSAQAFTVDSRVSVEVRNQNPIGLDTLIKINPGSGPADVQPASNDIDGNTTAPIAVKSGGGPFLFDDEGKVTPAPTPPGIIHGLLVKCIGPVPPLDPTTKLPTTLPGCTDPAMKQPGQALEITALDNSGKITATLNADLTKVNVATDASVAGLVPFAAVVVDNYGGAAWSLVTIEIPDQPPDVIPGRQTVPMNSPPVVVLDTRLAARDANGDIVKVSSITQPAHGTATISADRFTISYQPAPGYVGPDSLTLNVTDGRGVASNSALLNIDVVQPPTQPVAISSAPGAAGGSGGSGSSATPAGSLAKTGGDPVPLTIAASLSLLLGLALVHAGRRRQVQPFLGQARHLRT